MTRSPTRAEETALTAFDTGLAIALALIGSVGNAYAVVLQQHAVDATVSADAGDGSRTVSLRRMLTLVRTPRWVAGIGLVLVAAAFHIGALALAPITIIQPVGVLAVLFAIVFASRQRRSWPGGRVWLGAALTVAGITGFVLVAAVQVTTSDEVPGRSALVAAGVLLVLSLGCACVGALGRSWAKCLGWAAACSIVFGLASALMRSATLAIRAHTPWLSPTMVGLAIGLVLCYASGGWLAQQAYASGPPEIVMSSLTVLDPLVAVCFGLAVLGEGSQITVLGGTGMTLAALLAGAGVVVLARHHPETTKAS